MIGPNKQHLAASNMNSAQITAVCNALLFLNGDDAIVGGESVDQMRKTAWELREKLFATYPAMRRMKKNHRLSWDNILRLAESKESLTSLLEEMKNTLAIKETI